jgi:hypothetical protein
VREDVTKPQLGQAPVIVIFKGSADLVDQCFIVEKSQ